MCKIEDGYSWRGGTTTTSDTCVIACGDGVSLSSDPTSCDDGNIISGDGCSSLCRIEFGFKWRHTLPLTKDTCDDIWGDGINVKPQLNYNIRRCLVPLNDRYSPKFVRGLDNGDFLFFKIFYNFTTFIPKVQPEGCFIISSYLNNKNKQK